MTQGATERNKNSAITVFLNGIERKYLQGWRRTKESGTGITGGLEIVRENSYYI